MMDVCSRSRGGQWPVVGVKATYNHGEHLLSSQNGAKIRPKKMCVCVCVCTCAGICTSVSCMQQIIHTHPVPYNLGIYCLEFTMAYIPSFLQLGAHHPHRIDICIHDQSKVKMKIELWKP